MPPQTVREHVVRCARAAPGFTLMEVLVALAVLSVGLGVAAGLFTASLSLGQQSRNQRIATEIAETALRELCAGPQFYHWDRAAADDSGLFPVRPVTDADGQGHLAVVPATVPAVRAAATQTRGLYERFRWQAHGRLPNEGAAYYEATVVVQWRQNGRVRMVALTSVVPRERVEGSA